MSNFLSELFLFYYTSYFKFFKFIKQPDEKAAANAIGIIFMDLILLLFVIFLKHFLDWFPSLHKGSNLRFFIIIIFTPLMYLSSRYIKIKTPYPNDAPFNLLRALIVSFTFPILTFLMIRANL